MVEKIIIAGPNVYTANGILQNVQVTTDKGIITNISAADKNNHCLQFPASYHIIPGFIDLHVHGANNKDVMDATPGSR